MLDHPPRGLIANLVTPLNHEGRPDGDALARLMARLDGQVSAFLAGSLRVGEARQLGLPSRLALLEAALAAGRGRVPLLFDITGPTEEGTIKLLEQAETLLKKLKPSEDVFFFLTPLVYHGNRDLPRHFKRLGQATRRRFIMSNNPTLVGVLRSRLRHHHIRTAVLKKLAANEQLVGLEFEGDLDRALGYQRAVQLHQGFRFYDGSEESFLERPSPSGLISGGACLAPQAWSELVASSLNSYGPQRAFPDFLSRIWQHSQEVRALMEVYSPNPAALIKAALKIMGVIENDATAPGTPPADPTSVADLKDLLTELKLV
jgi:dihydrodipicolinate synthase/N-acetylneuraminate lyase